MRLSEAIRLGAMLRPQGKHYIFLGGKSCAMGAALEAYGVAYYEGRMPHEVACRILDIQQSLPKDTPCPECSIITQAYLILEHLNDMHGWSREAIADWVQQVEDSLASAPVSPACEARESLEVEA